MKTHLFLMCGLLAISMPTKATDLDDFYVWTNKKICHSGDVKCDSNYFKGRVQLLSGNLENYSWITYGSLKNIYYRKTCYVKVNQEKQNSSGYSIGDKGYIDCAQKWEYVKHDGSKTNHNNFEYKPFTRFLIENYDRELWKIYDKAVEYRDLKTLNRLKSEFSHHQVSTKARVFIDEASAFEEKQRHSILADYQSAKTIQHKAAILNKIDNKEKVSGGWITYSDVIDDDMASKFVSDIFKSVRKENNIAGYSWFIKNNPYSKQAKQALTNMHRLAFELAEDIDTIDGYNDFVIAYPTAKHVREANDRAFELEKSEYVGMLSYFSEEKDARRLLVQSKMLEQSAEDLSSDERVGYMMVVNRMNDLLKQEFNSTDAALRHLESNEFKSFVRTFKRSMKDLKRQVSRIADNTADLSSIMKNQSSMMNNHFENAAQDRKMASELTKQHRHWERFIGEVGL